MRALERAHAVILAFADRADNLIDPDPATVEAFRDLLCLANEIRGPVKGGKCGHQNEDYPGMRCVRRFGHKGRHAKPSSGASW